MAKKPTNNIDTMLKDLYNAADSFDKKAEAIGLILKYESIKLKGETDKSGTPSFFTQGEDNDGKGTTETAD